MKLRSPLPYGWSRIAQLGFRCVERLPRTSGSSFSHYSLR